MNIESTKIKLTQETSIQKTSQNSPENDGKFAEELKTLKKPAEEKETEKVTKEQETKETSVPRKLKKPQRKKLPKKKKFPKNKMPKNLHRHMKQSIRQKQMLIRTI